MNDKYSVNVNSGVMCDDVITKHLLCDDVMRTTA